MCRFVAAENTTVDAAYFAALAADHALGRTRGIDGALKKFALDAIILPTDGACLADPTRAVAFCIVFCIVFTALSVIGRLHVDAGGHRRVPHRHRQASALPPPLLRL